MRIRHNTFCRPGYARHVQYTYRLADLTSPDGETLAHASRMVYSDLNPLQNALQHRQRFEGWRHFFESSSAPRESIHDLSLSHHSAFGSRST